MKVPLDGVLIEIYESTDTVSVDHVGWTPAVTDKQPFLKHRELFNTQLNPDEGMNNDKLEKKSSE